MRGYTDSMESSLYINNRNVQVIDRTVKVFDFQNGDTSYDIYFYIQKIPI